VRMSAIWVLPSVSECVFAETEGSDCNQVWVETGEDVRTEKKPKSKHSGGTNFTKKHLVGGSQTLCLSLAELHIGWWGFP